MSTIRQNETRSAPPSPHRRAAAVPAATALAIDFEAGVGDHNGVLELDESTLRMLQRGLHRQGAAIVAGVVPAEAGGELPAFFLFWTGGGGGGPGPRGDEKIIEDKPAVRPLPPQRFGQFALGRARTVMGDDREHRFDHAL